MGTSRWDERYFRQVVSGEASGILAGAGRVLLGLAETPYSLAMRIRNRRYDSRPASIHRCGVPVISVGNLTLGGTGKTPLVCHLARRLREQQVRVAIVSRGYRPNSQLGVNDEALELEQRLPDVPHVQNRDRVAAAQLAIKELETQLIVLDDGFQHRRLARDLDIVLLDALCPFGYGHVFPRGYLREPLGGLARADMVMLTRRNLVDADRRALIRRQVQQLAPRAGWTESSQLADHWLTADGTQLPLSTLHGRRVLAFCAIGNPQGFQRTLAGLHLSLVDLITYPDHHLFLPADVADLATRAREGKADYLVCTHKDLVKIDASAIDGVEIVALTLEVQFDVGEELLGQRLRELAERAKLA